MFYIIRIKTNIKWENMLSRIMKLMNQNKKLASHWCLSQLLRFKNLPRVFRYSKHVYVINAPSIQRQSECFALNFIFSLVNNNIIGRRSFMMIKISNCCFVLIVTLRFIFEILVYRIFPNCFIIIITIILYSYCLVSAILFVCFLPI